MARSWHMVFSSWIRGFKSISTGVITPELRLPHARSSRSALCRWLATPTANARSSPPPSSLHQHSTYFIIIPQPSIPPRDDIVSTQTFAPRLISPLSALRQEQQLHSQKWPTKRSRKATKVCLLQFHDRTSPLELCAALLARSLRFRRRKSTRRVSSMSRSNGRELSRELSQPMPIRQVRRMARCNESPLHSSQ